MGSSPRVWGQAHYRPNLITLSRIIPTRMGTRTFSATLTPLQKDHPHAYGDKLTDSLLRERLKGSSPRVWGQEKKKPRTNQGFGIIPTRMGTRSLVNGNNFISRDHPHAYGDKLELFPREHLLRGSSPRVWGQVSSSTSEDFKGGIIPTRMGTRGIFVRLG